MIDHIVMGLKLAVDRKSVTICQLPETPVFVGCEDSD